MLAAIACGTLIGIDRELKERLAGLRTHALVSMSAAAFTILCGTLFARVHQYGDVTEPDFLRISEGVIAGVAFLGAGSIIQGRRGVAGPVHRGRHLGRRGGRPGLWGGTLWSRRAHIRMGLFPIGVVDSCRTSRPEEKGPGRSAR